MKKEKPLAIVFVVLGVVLAFQTVVMKIDPGDLPEDIAAVVTGAQYILSTTSAGIAFTILRNFLGYTKDSLGAEAEGEGIHYEIKLLGSTWAKYQMSIMGFTKALQIILLGTPYEPYAVLIVSAATLLGDVVSSTVKSWSKASAQAAAELL